MRKTEVLRKNWRFSRGDFPEAIQPSFDDAVWDIVHVPHDWAANGPFYKDYDAQFTRIVNDGEKKKSLHLGRTGGLPHDGKGVYRKKFVIPASDQGCRFRLEFDGVMSHSQVYVNGIHAGGHPYGYVSFACDITDFVKPGEENVLTVTVNNPPASARWYPGAGIYRKVTLVTTNPCCILYNGVWIRTQAMEDGSASGSIELKTSMPDSTFRFRILDDSNQEAAAGEGREGKAEFTLPSCRLWEPGSPHLYHAEITLLNAEGEECDFVQCRFGVRTILFDSEKGMFINGKSFRMNGVCMHHDLGPLGAAFNRCAAERQLRILQGIGVNALRCTHNPPAPEVLDLCDELGIVAIDEAFDCWQMGKVENDYHLDFDEWHERDLTGMIFRDRNHPCVILWSIGNEILEQQDPNGWKLAERLQDIVHRTDPDRKVTAALSFEKEAIDNGMAAVMDVPGFNYKPHRYQDYHDRLPGKPIFGSETASTISSRGVYTFPIREGWTQSHPSIQCSSYDVEYPAWASTPDKEFYFQDRCPWVMGEFVWTGFDYLGEPCPYGHQWPAHSSYFGIFDLVGLPKDRAYLYKSRWNREEPTLHILPHWNFFQYQGRIVPVHVYTSFDDVELFVNGKSQGRRKKNGDARLHWDYVFFEPGELKAVAYNPDGSIAMTSVRKTTGVPAKIKLELENTKPIVSDGEDLAFVRITACDAEGNEHPTASDRVFLTILNGPVEFAGIANGDPTSLETFDQNHIHLFNGKAVVYLRALEGASGTATLLVEAEHLEPEQIQIQVQCNESC